MIKPKKTSIPTCENSQPKIITIKCALLSPLRLDKYLVTALSTHHYSRSFIQNLITTNQVNVNGNIITNANFLIKNGDDLVINIISKTSDHLVAKPVNFTTLYEDDDIIVINKPNNLVVHPGAGNWDNTLVNGLLFADKLVSSDASDFRPGIVHRLDKQTTGCLIVAKNSTSHQFLQQQLQKHAIKRIYFALVHGTIKGRTGTIKAPIARSTTNRLKMAVNEKNSKEAITHFTVFERFKNYTLVQCELETGRTHQIRVHFAWIKHPVFNDSLYSNMPVEDASIGQYLHAKIITFVHPTTKKVMTFECDLPDFFSNKLQLLRKESVK